MNKLILILIVFFSYNLSAYVVPNDTNYKVLKRDGHRLIYSKDNADISEYALTKFIEVSKIFEAEFGWELDETPTLTLTSNKNQLANAFATTTPALVTAFFPSHTCLLYTSPSPRDATLSRMPSSA